MKAAPEELKERFGHRLRRARMMRGMTLAGLSEAIDGKVSANALSKYETGKMQAGSQVLRALGRALQVEASYFFRTNELALEEIAFRKTTKLGKKELAQIQEGAMDFFERYLETEDLLGICPPALPRYVIDAGRDVGEQVEQAAHDLRVNQWRLGYNPLSNVHILLEEYGVKVKEIDAPESFNGFSGWACSATQKSPVVALARHLNGDLPRKRFTALHELAHLVLDLPSELEEKEEEALCHRFAGALLIPREQFARAFGGVRPKISIPELSAIKQEWGLSMAAIMKRAENLNLIKPAVHKSFRFYLGKMQWLKIEPSFSDWHGDERSQRFSQLVYRAYTDGVLTLSKACSLLEIPAARFSALLEPKNEE